jgi:endoglucanase
MGSLRALLPLLFLLGGSGCGHDEPTRAAGPDPLVTTCGRWLVDGEGRRVKLAGVNWYGASDTEQVVGGLDVVPIASVVQTIVGLGFNTVRLPFSHEMLATDAAVAEEHIAANPELFGKTPLEAFDAVVEALTEAEIFVLLNSHTSHAMWCCSLDQDGVWFTADYDEERFMSDWEMLAERYAQNPFVIGADLRNELRPAFGEQGIIVPTWGGGGAADWHDAATRAGNRVLAKNPNLLIIVEGLDSADNLTAVGDLPIVLEVDHRVVYQSHQYAFFPTPPGDFEHPYGDMTAAELEQASHDKWGYLLQAGRPYTAPVLLGEFGAESQNAWLSNLEAYMAEIDVDFTYWPLNGGPKASGDSEPYGLLEDDWTTVRSDARIGALQALVEPTRGPGIDLPSCPAYDR